MTLHESPRVHPPDGDDGAWKPIRGDPEAATTPEEENRRLRRALQAAEARFHSTVERSVDGVIVVDVHDRIRFANESAQRLFGRSGGDLLGTEFGLPAVAGERAEIDLLRGDGKTTVAEMRVTETAWEAEDALLVLLRDVTDRKDSERRERELAVEQGARAEAEAQARRAEILDRVGQVLGSTLDLDALLRGLAGVVTSEVADVCLIDVDDSYGPLRRLAVARKDYPHRAVLKGLEERPVRLGLDTAEARVFRTGRSELVPEVTDEWLEHAAREEDAIHALHKLEPCSMAMIGLQAGALPWGVITILSCDPGLRFGPADLQLFEELVHRAGITIENARLFRLARDASRAKSDFLAVVSHELRTPLSAVIGYTGLLEERISGPLTERQAEQIQAIRRSAEHLLRLIDQIITFARLEGDHERLEQAPVDLRRVAEEVATLARPLAERKGLELRVVLPEEDATLVTDERKLAQVLVNLVTNAIKYTEEGGVSLEVELGENVGVMRVRDTGIGIPTDKLEEVFEPFLQLEDPRTRREGGAGIGLSIVRNLTRLLGGEIGVESEPGRGSTFTVRLPMRAAVDPAAP